MLILCISSFTIYNSLEINASCTTIQPASIFQAEILNVAMTELDPALFSRNYRRSISNPIPVAFSDQVFLDQVAETTKIFDVKKRLLPGPIRNTEEDGQKILNIFLKPNMPLLLSFQINIEMKLLINY